MLTTHWNHLGFLISIPGVRNVLQSQEGFLIFVQKNVSNFSMFLGVSGDFATFFKNFLLRPFLKNGNFILNFYFKFSLDQNSGKDPKKGGAPKQGRIPYPRTAACRASNKGHVTP